MPPMSPSALDIADCACLNTPAYMIISPSVSAPSIVAIAIHRYMP